MSRILHTLILAMALNAIPIAAYYGHTGIGFLIAFYGFSVKAPAWAEKILGWAYPKTEEQPSEAATLGVDLITSVVSQGGGTIEVNGVWKHDDGREFQCRLYAEAQQINQPSK